MNSRRILKLILASLIATGLVCFLRSRPPSAESPSATEAKSEPPPQESPSGVAPAVPPISPAPKAHPASATSEPPAAAEAARYTRSLQADPEYDWKQPINFYGRVVDESNHPIPAANVHLEWNDLSQKGSSEADVQSDSHGLFSLLGQQGKRLFVDVGKDGYWTSRRNPLAFEYANPAEGLFRPDPARPVLFVLREKGKAAQLIHGLKLFGSRVDGTLSYVNLTDGRNSSTQSGDLTVQCTRSEPNADKKFDWTFTLGGLDGGVAGSTNEFDFAAPESGYQSAYQIKHRATDPDWTGREKLKFFVKSQGGQHYARIEITVIPDYNQNAAYDLEWFMNPSGSPNLEYDPSNSVQAGR